MYVRKPGIAVLVFLLLMLPAACRRQSGITASAESAAIEQLRTLNAAQTSFQQSNGHYACTLTELGTQAGLVDKETLSGQRDGYAINLHCAQKNGRSTYQIWASPADAALAGAGFYCIDQSGLLRRTNRRLDDCAAARPLE
ncbi:MAG: hypothetical protein WCE75_17575 [Terracidiphilus sp.]